MKRGRVARRNPRDRRAFVVACASVAGILVCASLLVWLASSGMDARRSGDTIGGPFSLTDDRGNPVSERSFPGKYLVVYFGYTTCPDICPATLTTLTASLDRLGRKADRVQPLFVTIDPAHDTPAVLHHYVGAFSGRLVGLSGSDVEVAKIADEYKVVRAVHNSPEPHKPTGFDHSAVLYLMAPDGRFVAPIQADASEMVMAEVIGRYVL
jgi:protein SCO1/2